jgi:hypothetical protein
MTKCRGVVNVERNRIGRDSYPGRMRALALPGQPWRRIGGRKTCRRGTEAYVGEGSGRTQTKAETMSSANGSFTSTNDEQQKQSPA